MKTARDVPRDSALPARYDVMGLGHDAYRDLLAILGRCVPEVVGWCEVDAGGAATPALVVSQAWPFLPLGADPKPFIKARKYAALIPDGRGFRVVEVSAPPAPPSSTSETP